MKVTDHFWGQRLDASRKVTIPLAFSKCEETGRYKNFEKAAHPSDTIKVGGLSFDDTDVYKTIEVPVTRCRRTLTRYCNSISTVYWNIVATPRNRTVISILRGR